MRVFAAALLVLSLAAPAMAQDDAAQRREAAESYIRSPAQQDMLDQMLSADALVEQMQSMAPQMTPEVAASLGEIAAEEMAALRPDLEAAMVDAAIETFTLAEIVAVDEFYRSEAGASVARKMQPFMARAMGSLGPRMQQVQMNIMTRAMEMITGQQGKQ